MTNTLNRLFKTSLMAAVAAGSVLAASLPANAEMTGTVETAAADIVENTSAVMLDNDLKVAIEQSNGQNFDVRRPSELSDQEEIRIQDMASQEHQKVAALQSSIRGNETLVAALAEENVSVDSVVDVRLAANGDLIIYQM